MPFWICNSLPWGYPKNKVWLLLEPDGIKAASKNQEPVQALYFWMGSQRIEKSPLGKGHRTSRVSKCAEFLIVCKNDVSYTFALPRGVFVRECRMVWGARLSVVFATQAFLSSQLSSLGSLSSLAGTLLNSAQFLGRPETESQRSFPPWTCLR